MRLDGLHVTLRFLGPTPVERVDELAAAMAVAASAAAPIPVRISGAGAFPSQGRPRALWLGIAEGGEGLAALAARLDDGLVALGWPHEERPFRAHLTLARADGVRAGAATAATLRDAASEISIESVTDRLVLYESITGHGPARYVSRAEAALG